VQRKKSRTYTSVVFETPATMADEVAGILVAHGAMGCEVTKITGARSPRVKKKMVSLHAYFDQLKSDTATRIAGILKSAGMLRMDAAMSIRQINDPGWATMWQTRFEPFCVGEHFLIVPPWNREQVNGRIQIVVRPGQAFGTGHHASTRGSLAMIEHLCHGHSLKRALDVGTGSGILAIAMRKLGVAQVTAIDIDAAALENAHENAELNATNGAVRFSAVPLSSIRGRFDLITANILGSVLIEMAPQLKSRLRPGGYLVLAGILVREADSVVAAYLPELRCVTRQKDHAWTALVFQR
jgi:ribosomal protein L11 methyltransferase